MTPAELTGPAVTAWLMEVERTVTTQSGYLTQLDAAIGDGDHGTNISRGFQAVREALDGGGPDLGPGEALRLAGNTLLSTVGGASGALWGSALRRAGKALGDGDTVDSRQFLDAINAAVDAVVDLGAAAPGDKTMVDALMPAQAALREQIELGQPLAAACQNAATAAEAGARSSAALEARKGRASYLGSRSVGHQDPGATSTAMIFDALARTLSD